MMQTIVSIPGMHCASCANLIKDVSSEFPQIQNVDIDMSSKKVTLEHNEDFDFQKWSDELKAIDPKYAVEKAVSS